MNIHEQLNNINTEIINQGWDGPNESMWSMIGDLPDTTGKLFNFYKFRDWQGLKSAVVGVYNADEKMKILKFQKLVDAFETKRLEDNSKIMWTSTIMWAAIKHDAIRLHTLFCDGKYLVMHAVESQSWEKLLDATSTLLPGETYFFGAVQPEVHPSLPIEWFVWEKWRYVPSTPIVEPITNQELISATQNDWNNNEDVKRYSETYRQSLEPVETLRKESIIEAVRRNLKGRLPW